MKPRKPTIPALLLLMPLFAACPTPADDVCADLGLCATAGAAPKLQGCQSEAAELGSEAYDATLWATLRRLLRQR